MALDRAKYRSQMRWIAFVIVAIVIVAGLINEYEPGLFKRGLLNHLNTGLAIGFCLAAFVIALISNRKPHA